MKENRVAGSWTLTPGCCTELRGKRVDSRAAFTSTLQVNAAGSSSWGACIGATTEIRCTHQPTHPFIRSAIHSLIRLFNKPHTESTMGQAWGTVPALRKHHQAELHVNLVLNMETQLEKTGGRLVPGEPPSSLLPVSQGQSKRMALLVPLRPLWALLWRGEDKWWRESLWKGTMHPELGALSLWVPDACCRSPSSLCCPGCQCYRGRRSCEG